MFGDRRSVTERALLLFVTLSAAFASGCGGGPATTGQLFSSAPAATTPQTTDSAVKASVIYACNKLDSRIDIYTADLGGSVEPLNTLPAKSACAVTGDSAGTIYVASSVVGGSVVTAFPQGSTTNARTINLPNPSLTNQVTTMTTDSSGNLYVAMNSQVIYVYAPDAAGQAPPLHTISGAATTISSVNQMAVDAEGDLYVAEGFVLYGAKLVMFAPGADGNVVPTTITDSTYAPVGVALDSAGNIYVAQARTTTLLPGSPAYMPDAIYVFAKGSVAGSAPVRTITGSATDLVNAGDVQVDAAGNIFVLTYSDTVSTLLVFSATANGNSAPDSTMYRNNKEQGVLETQFFLR